MIDDLWIEWGADTWEADSWGEQTSGAFHAFAFDPVAFDTVWSGPFNPRWAVNSNSYIGPKGGASDS